MRAWTRQAREDGVPVADREDRRGPVAHRDARRRARERHQVLRVLGGGVVGALLVGGDAEPGGVVVGAVVQSGGA